MKRSITLSDSLLDYIHHIGTREHPVLAQCREETAALGPQAIMQISAEQGAFMAMLVRLIEARQTLEIGTFTGYSALAIALALPHDGRLIACDIDPDRMKMASRYWQEAGVADKIDAKIGPAVDTLQTLIDEEAGKTMFDFAFIDADKTNYDSYYEYCLKLVRAGGLIAIDNVLWSGSVIDPDDTSDDTVAIRLLNNKIAEDERVDIALVPIGDGVTLCRKR